MRTNNKLNQHDFYKTELALNPGHFGVGERSHNYTIPAPNKLVM